MNQSKQSQRMSRGLRAIVVLAVLTAVEFVVAMTVSRGNGLVPILVVIAVVKAWVIADYFMHIYQLWRSER